VFRHILTYLFIYLLPIYLFSYLHTIYLFIYLYLTATPLFPASREFIRATMAKPRDRSMTVLLCTMQCRPLLNMVQFWQV